MRYRMVAIDMDGTLLNHEDEISDANLYAIRKAMSDGIKVVISTGRIFAAVKHYAKLLGLKAHVISANGAVISDAMGQNVIYTKPMDVIGAARCIEIARKYDIYYHCYANDTLYTEKLAYTSWTYSKLNETLPPEERIVIQRIDDGVDFVLHSGYKIMKLVMIDDDADKLAKARYETMQVPSVAISSSMPNNFEVMARGVSKGRALEILADHYNIKMEHVVAIGDSENDISMLERVGLPIAMGNAADEVKNIARYTVPSNDEDGVAYALNCYVISEACSAL
jgi:HAD-superfamily hydrolase, subfamily IIB